MVNSKLYIEKNTKNLILKESNGLKKYIGTDSLFSNNINSNYSSKSLLRYPGGKSRAVKIITQFIPKDICEICSPFFGGGSIEIYCASKGVRVYGYDKFEPLVDFWNCLQLDNKLLADYVKDFFPLRKKTFYNLQKKQLNYDDKFMRAAVFYVLNRSSYSGATLSGGMSPNHPRFTESSIDRLIQFKNPNFTVGNEDFTTSLLLHKDTFKYLDPPYLIENNLYGNKGDQHKGFNHLKLFELLKDQNNWLLSYNNSKEIREIYRDYKILFPQWKYGMSNDKESKEVLIFSNDLKRMFNL